MYLIELNPGKEAIYGSQTDFAEAIRRGEVGWEARIYHRARSTWIPVALHPHFKQVAGTLSAGSRRPAPRAQWTFLPPEPGQAGSASPATPAPEADQAAGSQAAATRTTGAKGWRRVLGG